jgi:hypothetical protein
VRVFSGSALRAGPFVVYGGQLMGFWGSIFGGSNPTLNSGINQSGQVAGFGQSQGEGLLTSAGNFFSGLLGGNPAQAAKLLAPQIQQNQQQAQQQKQVNAQFGNRSGGTNASNQTIDDKTRSNISTMISNLTGQAAGAAASMGQNLLDTGMKALSQQVDFSQEQMANWGNSILGQGVSQGVGAAMKAGMSFL